MLSVYRRNVQVSGPSSKTVWGFLSVHDENVVIGSVFYMVFCSWTGVYFLDLPMNVEAIGLIYF